MWRALWFPRHCGAVPATASHTAAAAAVARQFNIRRTLPPPGMRRALREANGLTTTDLATPLGVTRQSISKWESGKRTPRGELLKAYVAVLEELAAAMGGETARYEQAGSS